MNNLSINAKIYILGSIILGFGVAAYEFIGSSFPSPIVLGIAILASAAQILKVEGSTHQSSYNIAWITYGFSFVLFGLEATLVVILVSHIIEWLWHKYPWYIQLFNIATYIFAAFFSFIIFDVVSTELAGFSSAEILSTVVSLGAFTFVNHLMIGLVLFFARGQNFKESGIFGYLTLMIDYTLISLGAGAAFLWQLSPFASIFALVPIYLIYSTLRVPALERQTEIDPKTKLYNAKFFQTALEKELTRAERYNRPLTVVMADLDLLRNINNTYGHMAGDIVLVGIADIFKSHFRGYDVVSRFGGEEFAVILPETTPEEAYPRVENIRKEIEARGFPVSTSVTPINATMSFGISGRSERYQTMNEIIHNSDVALYHAKNKGRNHVVVHSDEGLEEFFGLKREGEVIPQNLETTKAGATQSIGVNTKLENRIPEIKEGESQPSSDPHIPQYSGKLNAFILFTGFIALILASFIIGPVSNLDWLGLGLFAISVMLAEGLALEIYSNDASVSTSAAPFIGAVLLFGPWGALSISVLLAGVSFLKKRSHFRRFIFNVSNHLIASLLVAFIVNIFDVPFSELPHLTQISLAVLAGIIIFISSTMFLSGVIGLSLEKPFLAVWKERFRWLMLFYVGFGVAGYALVLGYYYAGVFGMLAMILPLWTIRFSQSQYIARTEGLVEKLRTQNKEMTLQKDEITTINNELLVCLAQAIDIRDSSTFGHSEIASHYAVQIGRELGLAQPRLEVLRKAGLLHDIGKLGIPEKILFKPASLSISEYDKIKKHPGIGAGLVAKSHSMKELIPAILHHHERWDGKGYPDNLRENEIPLEARIIGLADAVEAMASDRPYRKGLAFEKIIQEVKSNNGSQFDPTVVQAFMNIISREGEGFLKHLTPQKKYESVLVES